jgi:hypothetical protein
LTVGSIASGYVTCQLTDGLDVTLCVGFYQAENMAAPLVVCTKEGQRSVVHFVQTEGSKVLKFTVSYSECGDSAVCQRGECERIEMF